MAKFDENIVKDADFGHWEWPTGELAEVAARWGRSAPERRLGRTGVGQHPRPDRGRPCCRRRAARKLQRQLHSFLPKGEYQAGVVRLARKLAQLRPITLMQCSAKLIAAEASKALARYVATTVCGQQREFMNWRSISDNVVELGDGMVEHSMAVDTWPGTLLLVFASAFPSLARVWLFHVLRSLPIPSALLCITNAIYTDVATTLFVLQTSVGDFHHHKRHQTGLPAERHLVRAFSGSAFDAIPGSFGARRHAPHGVRR